MSVFRAVSILSGAVVEGWLVGSVPLGKMKRDFLGVQLSSLPN